MQGVVPMRPMTGRKGAERRRGRGAPAWRRAAGRRTRPAEGRRSTGRAPLPIWLAQASTVTAAKSSGGLHRRMHAAGCSSISAWGRVRRRSVGRRCCRRSGRGTGERRLEGRQVVFCPPAGPA